MTKVSRELILLRAQLPAASGVRLVLYQAAGIESGLIVIVDVYRPDKTQDTAQSGQAREVGNTGRYYLAFHADSLGWFVLIHDNAGGNGIQQF